MSDIAEAPVSWNTRYTSPEGYDCMLTLRGDNLKAVMTTAKAAIDAMAKAGCRPGNGNGHTSTPATNGASIDGQAAPMCPTHNKPMKQSQRGGWYCTVKIADNDGTGKAIYCKQRAQ